MFEHLDGFFDKIPKFFADRGGPRAPAHSNSVLGLLMVVAALLLVPLYDTRMLKPEGEDGGKIFSGGSCWADLPLHMTMAESFLHGRNQDVSWSQMVSPLFAGESLAYPFLPDFHAAVLVKIGTDLRWAFLITGLPLCLSLVALLYTFSLRLSRSPLAAVLAVLLVFGTGGMGGWSLSASKGFSWALTQDVAQNNAAGEGKVVWFAFLPHVVLPQRGATFAYPLSLVIFTLVWVATSWGRSAPSTLTTNARSSLLITAGALAGALPLVSAHAFLAIGVIIGTYALLDAHKWLAMPRLAASWVIAGVVCLAEAIPQLRQFSKHVGGGAGGKFLQYGWWFVNHDSGRDGGIGGFFAFWWQNIGTGLWLMIAALAVLIVEVFRARALALERLPKAPVESPPNATAAPVVNMGVAGPGSVVGVANEGVEEQPLPGVPVAHAYVTPAPPAGEAFFLGHLWSGTKKATKADFGVDLDAWLDIDRYGVRTSYSDFGLWANDASLSGRAFDALKFALGAFAVFLLGNYVMFQPWDRDNCKLWYVGLFVNGAVVGALLAAPIEFFMGIGSAQARMIGVLSAGPIDNGAYAQALHVALDGEASALLRNDDRVKIDEKMENETLKKNYASARVFAGVLALAGLAAFSGSTLTGFMMIRREFTLYHQLLDEDQRDVRKCRASSSSRPASSLLTAPPPPHPPPSL